MAPRLGLLQCLFAAILAVMLCCNPVAFRVCSGATIYSHNFKVTHAALSFLSSLTPGEQFIWLCECAAL